MLQIHPQANDHADTFPQDIISLYRKEATEAPIMFNYSPDSALWAIERSFPLSSNCTDSPGQDLVSRLRTNHRTRADLR